MTLPDPPAEITLRPRAGRSLRTVLLATIGILTLIIAGLTTREVVTEWRRYNRIQDLKIAARLSDQLFGAAEKLSVERDISYAILHAPDEEAILAMQTRLQESRSAADETLTAVTRALQTYDIASLRQASIDTASALAAIQPLRRELDRQALLPPAARDPELSDRWFKESTALILQTQALWMSFIRNYSNVDPAITLHLRYKHFLGIIIDYTGRERAVISRLIVENADPTPAEQADLLRWQGAIEMAWDRIGTIGDQSGLATNIESYIKEARSHYETIYDMVGDMFYIPGAHHEGTYPIDFQLWLRVANQATDSLYALKDAAFAETSRYHERLEREAGNAILINLFVLLVTLTLCYASFRVINRRVLGPIEGMIAALVSTTRGEAVTILPPTAGEGDEISKLAQVLHMLQRNMIDIVQSSRMLEHYTQDLERSNRELDDFAYIASHDLKEPLRGIHNHARFLLEDNADKLDEESVGRLNRLVYLSQRMEKLVNDLLYFSRLGRQDLAIQPSDLDEMVRDIEKTLENFLEERHAAIVVPTALPTLVCDKVRVTEVLRNLITNAVKYNDSETRRIEVGFLPERLTPDRSTARNVIYVRDNGRGIAPEFHTEIFRIFKRLQAGKGKEEDGTGVGLTFVKKIIERHGGQIWLESQPGRGTTFFFTLEAPT